jgi:hypothetical protein
MRPLSLDDAILNESWDCVARTIISFPIDIDGGMPGDNTKLRRLRKELEMIKHALYEQLMTYNGNKTLDASFFVGAFKAVSRIENGLDAQGVRNLRFVMLLKVLLQKLGKQRLLVKKPMEMRKEFGKMKRVVEHAGSL